MAWQNPLQTPEERAERLQDLLLASTDVDKAANYAKVLFLDTKGTIHVDENGDLKHIDNKIREN